MKWRSNGKKHGVLLQMIPLVILGHVSAETAVQHLYGFGLGSGVHITYALID